MIERGGGIGYLFWVTSHLRPFPDRFERDCSERWRANQLRTISEMTFALVMILASITVALAVLLLSVALAPEPEFFTSAIVRSQPQLWLATTVSQAFL
jgi:hypothetical protein